MNKLKKIKNACSCLALKYVSLLPDDVILHVCGVENFTTKDGMMEENIMEAAKDLNIKYKKLKNFKCQTIEAFIKNHPTGLYLVMTIDHVFCIHDGFIYDPREPKNKQRILTSAYLIMNKRTYEMRKKQ